MEVPDLSAVEQAAERIQSLVHETPVLQSQSINDVLGKRIYFKCENLQRTGAFKIRGATNAIASLEASEKIRGVITHSSGNHAAALACAAKHYGYRCQIVMPEDASAYKKQAVLAYGAQLTLCKAGMQARQSTTKLMMVQQPELKLIHPYDDEDVIAGQGTATLEFVDQVEGLKNILLPIGGGGLISGASIVLRAMPAEINLIGVEPEAVGEAQRSMADGVRYPATGNQTIADGLQAGIGELNFLQIRQGVKQIVTVSEQQIKVALRLIMERLKIVVEPSAAVPLAALLSGQLDQLEGPMGIILTGGNIDLDNFSTLI